MERYIFCLPPLLGAKNHTQRVPSFKIRNVGEAYHLKLEDIHRVENRSSNDHDDSTGLLHFKSSDAFIFYIPLAYTNVAEK